MAAPLRTETVSRNHVQICSNCRPDDRVRIEPAQTVWSVPTSLTLCPHAPSSCRTGPAESDLYLGLAARGELPWRGGGMD